MDLAVYISELLGINGELVIPGVGHFVQSRVNAYYNEGQNTFYPPSFQVIFEPKNADVDETLAGYISEKKNISLASSSYFVDKYLTNLKQEVTTRQVKLADLGWLSTEDAKLTFTPGNSLKGNDALFYGFPPVKVYKIGSNPVAITPPLQELPDELPELVEPEVISQYKFTATPIIGNAEPEEKSAPALIKQEETVAIMPVSEPSIYSPDDETFQLTLNPNDDEEDVKRGISIWLILLITLIVIGALAVFALYKYKPSLFDPIIGKHKTTIAARQKVLAPAKDSINPVVKPKTVPISRDLTLAISKVATPAVLDTLKTLHYELETGPYKTKKSLNVALQNYKAKGLSPRVLKHAAGKRYKITLGTYFNKAEAIRAEDSIKTATRLSKILLQPINPQL